MKTAAQIPKLHRTEPAPPRRIVHLGLGAFSRSHVAWYTAAADDAASWGISAYTGSSQELAERLTRQDGLFTLVERADAGDRGHTVTSIVSARPGGEVSSLVADLTAPETAIVTLTITEVGYRLTPHDAPDLRDPTVVGDTEVLRAVAREELGVPDAGPRSALGRLLLGLEARRRVNGGPLAIISCDNLADNGGRTRRGLLAWAELISPEWARWITHQVAFVSSSVDRITPRVDDAEMRELSVRYGDLAPVVAEPFHDWVLSGDFPAGRPAWESAGARFVDELGPWEDRKLWLLNGAHTILASLGLLRSHDTVAAAIADETCRAAVERYWDEAERHLPAEVQAGSYRQALTQRFQNLRIEHRLAQIASDTEAKIRVRIVPVAEHERASGSDADGCAGAIGAWIAAGRAELIPDTSPGVFANSRECIRRVSSTLADDEAFAARVEEAIVRATASGLSGQL